MKKILLVNDLVNGGGVEKLIYDFIWAWHEHYEIGLLTEEYVEKEEFTQIFPNDITYYSLSLPKKERNGRITRRIDRIRRKQHRKQIMQSIHNAGYQVVLAMKEGRIMKMVHDQLHIPLKLGWVHTDYDVYYYTHWDFGTKENERNAMADFNHVVCVSEQIKKSICRRIGDPGNLIVGYNPINVELIKEKAKEPIVDLEISNTNRVKFVTVGRLNQQKGFDLLLEACHMLNQEKLDFEVWLIGGAEFDGAERDRLNRIRQRLDVENVKFLGARRNPYKYMKHGDWFLSTSIFEGYSLVSQEAAILDVPILATDCSGVRELLGENGEYGIVMGISVYDIYRSMKRVIEHPELQAQYKEKIMERKKIINFNQRIQDIENLFKEQG